jgi:hypothetical protein
VIPLIPVLAGLALAANRLDASNVLGVFAMTDAKVRRRDLVGIAGAGAMGMGIAPLAGCDGRTGDAPRGAAGCAGIATIRDFGAVSGKDVVTAMTAALTAVARGGGGVLIIPPGEWLIGRSVDWSDFRRVTLRIEPGAILNHGPHAVVLPPFVDTGTTPNAAFMGEGAVSTRDKDAISYARMPAGWHPRSNFAIGVGALPSSASGSNNFAWGANALRNTVGASGNIAIGNDTLTAVQGGKVPAEGTQTGYGWSNIAIGETVLRDCTDGYENLGIGAFCLQQTTTGRWNIAIGHASQIIANTAEGNISLGAYALVTNSGSNNIAIGWAALEGQATGSNIAIGHMAMNANTTGHLNTAIGIEAMMRLRSGNQNVSVGVGALTNLVSGSGNTGVGSYALSRAAGGAADNTALGRDALIAMTGGNNNTAVGAGALSTLRGFSNCTGLGSGAAVTGNNQVQLGNANAVPHAFAALQIRSDARDKTDVRDTVLGLDFIKALRPVDFRWNLREAYRGTGATSEPAKKRNRFHHGLLAQDVRDVIAQSGKDFGGFQDHAVNGGQDVLSLGYEELIAPLIKAVQELSAQVDDLRQQLSAANVAQRPL